MPALRPAGEQFPDTASEYAAAGTLAHAIAGAEGPEVFRGAMSNRAFNARLKKLKEDPHYDKGMDAATDTYLEHLKALAMSYGSVQPFVALETRVDFRGLRARGLWHHGLHHHRRGPDVRGGL